MRGSVEDPVRGIVITGLTFRHANRTVMETKEPLLRSDWAIYRGGAIFFNGAADCMLDDAVIDQVGGNAVFVNNYNRRITIRGCEIVKAGASGVVFLGDYQAARNPLFNYNQTQNLADIDRTAGAKSDNYPADCLVDDCLIHLTGRVEKQTAGVNIDLAQNITIRHCSIYDMPRAGINIGDGCWGGHIIEFCDVFDTVKETGDHGSFNSWGRDRFWKSDHRAWEPAIQQEPALPYLDAMKPTIIRNSRWRCDHGWDIDLDDGSTNYHIYNNLCLNGGLKSREGFGRVVENNILIGGFHPHVWYDHSEDIVRRNIMSSDQYHPAGNIPEPWGKEIDYNLVHRAGVTQREPATKLAEQSKRDAHSIIADAMFIDAATGDFRVKPNSPALKLGFVNFPMDRFGVQNEQLKASARTPEMPKLFPSLAATAIPPSAKTPAIAWSAKIRNISGMGERSAYGLPDESGVLLLEVPAASPAAKAGLTKDDVIVACDGKPVHTVADLLKLRDASAAKSWSLAIIRKQKPLTIQISSDR